MENTLTMSQPDPLAVPDHIQAIAEKYGKGKKEAFIASAKRVSRRLLLAMRAEKLSVVCPVTGIVSLLEVPAIPGFALVYEHPLSSLANCRGIAQRGQEYLRKLDTQTLAGILIVLADSYDLFAFLESDSGAQKNAILRTAGKDILIDAIVLIEEYVHSLNIRYLPKLSLKPDVSTDNHNRSVEIRLHQYLTLVTEALRKPDTSVYDENAAPKKIGRPVYIRDVQKQEKRISFMARQEQASAKKELSADAKRAKQIASNLVEAGIAKSGIKAFVSQLFADNGLGLIAADPALLDMLISQKLSLWQQNFPENKDIPELITILRKDRSILKVELSETDDLPPGQEDAIEELPEPVAMTQEEYDANPTIGTDSENMGNDLPNEPTPPAGLSSIQQILWLKKWRAANGKQKENSVKYVAPEIPSVVTYTPSEEKQKLGKE
jgi:hypothetical protein